MEVAQQFASDGVAQRSVVLTPVPAFGSSVYRFLPQSGTGKMSRCAAAADDSQCTLAKGRATKADPAQSQRLAKATHTTSYMAPPSSLTLPSSSLLDLVLRSTNEMRLQELYDLYNRRKLIGPGPGEHDAKLLKAKQSHHRPHAPDRDGPSILNSQQASTRSREMEQQLSRHCPGSGLGPGHYDGARSKDICLRNGKTGGRIGSAVRGSAKGLVLYAPSVSNVISQQVDASMEPDPNMPHAESHTVNQVFGQTTEVGKFHFIPTAAKGSSTAPTVIECAPCGSDTHEKIATCEKQKTADAGQSQGVHANRDLTSKAVFLEPGRQHRSLPKHPPCPRQLLASASHCDMPGDWDWNSLNRSSLSTFSSQSGGCHCSSRTALEIKIEACKRFEPDTSATRCWEGPSDATIESLSVEHRKPSKSMTTIPEDDIVAASFRSRTKRHKSLTDCGHLVSESEIRNHELAKSHAEEVIAVDARRRQWELYSSMYSTVLPLLKKQMAIGTTYSQME